MEKHHKFSIWYVLLGIWAVLILHNLLASTLSVRTIPYSEFLELLKQGKVAEVAITSNQIQGKMKNEGGGMAAGALFRTVRVDADLSNILEGYNVTFKGEIESTFMRDIFSWVVPIFIFVGIWYFMMRRMAGQQQGFMSLGKNKAKIYVQEEIDVRFADVAGVDESKQELVEVIEFLKQPEKFTRLGGQMPRGILLVGPPGTGKTMLAKAVAGESGVPFFSLSGSEFVEMFVGVGAARVRDLFEQARKTAPAIVFIDEIDAIGQSRGLGIGLTGGNDEREQTLNQLLAEIDGFSTDSSRPVIIMAATNRPEVLDKALLRAGRFDRQVEVGNPDLIGRIQILKIHSKDIKLARDFDLERAARMTPGFSGADLANAMNEAALLAARRKAKAVTVKDFEAAMERVIAGLERKSRAMNESERKTVAYHESGHALVAGLLPNADPVAKIRIIPRARGALGYTLQMPTEDRYILTQDELSDRVAVMLGGRAAESTVLGTISTGASDDIQKATELVRRMVTEFGMSEKLGSVRYAGQQLQYIGGVAQDSSHLSPHTQQVIDGEVQRIVTEQYDRAQSLLRGNRGALEALAGELLEHETLDGSVVEKALAANKPKPRVKKTEAS